MKSKSAMLLISSFLLLNVISSHATDIEDKRALKERVAGMTDEQKQARLEEIRFRVNEIKEADKSTLTKAERKDMRKELREMNREAKVMKGGVYLSVGAIIIIILLLILIL